jgi:hypothetical protein
MSEVRKLTFFISSPGDVYEERTLAQRVMNRLQSEFAGRAVLEPVFWEHEPLLATDTFQTQISKPSDSDVMIAILWSRLGTRCRQGLPGIRQTSAARLPQDGKGIGPAGRRRCADGTYRAEEEAR